jgi:hypothetical protein
MRQAVVVFHGIGQQQPLDTLRGFLDGMLGEGRYWSKPDRLSESLELRRFTMAGEGGGIPATDFYEVYWAHRMKDGEFVGTLTWLLRITRTPFWKVSSSLRPLFLLLQAMGIAVVTLVGWSIASAVGSGGRPLLDVLGQWQTWFAVALGAVQFTAGRWLTGSLADAARYLTPSPANIEVRREVRAQGTQLVRALHEDGTYFRVVLVGHSLGSVIAYDVVRQLWDDLRHPADVGRAGKQPQAEGFDDAIDDLRRMSTEQVGRAVEEYQQAQHLLWRENRSRGMPWLVTDLVTLGSPLAHADLLLTTPRVSFARRTREREFPTCPPVPGDDGRSVYSHQYRATVDGSQVIRNFLVGHHAAPFGPTRWTNLYFPHRRLLLGDMIGGPVRESFGVGIRDVPVRPSYDGWRAIWYGMFPMAHAAYWRHQAGRTSQSRDERRERDAATGTKDALTSLRAALRLESLRSRRPWPPPDPPRRRGGTATAATPGRG